MRRLAGQQHVTPTALTHTHHRCSACVRACSRALLRHARRFVVCAKQQGGAARFINHSCQPNLYVQPMCVGHTDVDMVAIGLFAGLDIPSFTELT